MCSLEQWKQVVVSVFGRSIPAKYLNKLCANLILVHIGLKPSYLWDLPVKIKKTNIYTLVDSLKSHSLLDENVFAFLLCEEYFIINKRELENTLIILDEVVFVDCSAHIPNPVVIEDATKEHEMAQLFFKAVLNHISQNVLTVEIDADWYPPTLFGLLLGYPVVYWASSCENNLSQQTLLLCKLSYSTTNLPVEEAYSFSVPLIMSLISCVENWKDRLKNRFNGNLTLSTSNVSFTSVIL